MTSRARSGSSGGIVPGEAARVEIGVEEQQPRLDAEHVQGGEPERQDAVALHRVPQRVPDVQRVRRVDPDLVAEVAAVAGPADGHPRPADLPLRHAEVRDLLHLRDESLEQVARARALEGERPDVVAHLLDRDVVAADAVLEIGEVRLGAREEVLVLGGVQDDPVLDDEAAIVEPAGVLGLARRACPDVAGEDAGQERLRVLARDAVLEERTGVEQARGVADREVLHLVRHLVAVRGEIAGPVAPQLRLVERVRALVEGRGADHAVTGPLARAGGSGTISVIGRLRNIVLRCAPMKRMTPDQRREAIVAAALVVAVRKGLASTTVRDVAAEMGTSSGLIHHYFDSMDEVLAAAFERVAATGPGVSAGAMAEAASPVEALRVFFRTYTPADKDWAFQLWLDAWAEAARRPAVQADLTPAQPGVAGAAGADDRAGRGGRGVLLPGSGERRVADPVAARRARAPGRGPRDDDQPRRGRGLGDGRGRA